MTHISKRNNQVWKTETWAWFQLLNFPGKPRKTDAKDSGKGEKDGLIEHGMGEVRAVNHGMWYCAGMALSVYLNPKTCIKHRTKPENSILILVHLLWQIHYTIIVETATVWGVHGSFLLFAQMFHNKNLEDIKSIT